jgi:hypothetical protein
MGDQRPEDLPPREITRWMPRRKWQVVAAVRSGHLTLDEVCERYQLSAEEFLGWERALEVHGISGLKLSRLMDRRNTERSQI